VQIGGEDLQDPSQRPVPHPPLKAAMTCLIRRVPVGQIFPRRAGTQDPQDAIQHIARIAPRPPAAIASNARRREQWFEDGPLRVSEVHAVEYDSDRNFVHRPRLGLMR
jgi:hypothetical protein